MITYMANMEAPNAGPLKKDVELLNGRAAMIGRGFHSSTSHLKLSRLYH